MIPVFYTLIILLLLYDHYLSWRATGLLLVACHSEWQHRIAAERSFIFFVSPAKSCSVIILKKKNSPYSVALVPVYFDASMAKPNQNQTFKSKWLHFSDSENSALQRHVINHSALSFSNLVADNRYTVSQLPKAISAQDIATELVTGLLPLVCCVRLQLPSFLFREIRT